MANTIDWARMVDPRDATPLHAQLERSIRVAMASRRLQPGDQLPTVRQLAVALRLNANTDAPPSNHNEEARESELRAIATRALADASAKGFSAADLRRALTSLTKGASS
jgi:GntR family transcriptional regulator